MYFTIAFIVGYVVSNAVTSKIKKGLSWKDAFWQAVAVPFQRPEVGLFLIMVGILAWLFSKLI